MTRAGLLVLATCAAACAGAPRIEEPLEPGFQRGVALGFVHDDDEAGERRLDRALDEIRALGATDVSILVPLYTEGIAGRTVRRGALDDARGGDGDLGGEPAPVAIATATARADEMLVRTIRAARARGLRVLVFPFVRLRVRRPSEWRGRLAPADRAAWFAEYTRELEALASLCAEAGAARLAIGSELVSFEDDPARWRALARAIRARFPGRLLYSANWDRYDVVPFWDAVDEIGISAYFTLAERGTQPSVDQLVRAWSPIVAAIERHARSVHRPVVFTEVGYPAVEGAAFWPWNDHLAKVRCAEGEGCEGALSPQTQRRLWAAFVRVFSDRRATSFLTGTYAWLWSGDGGLRDRGYNPRGKPAQSILRLWYRDEPFTPLYRP